MDQILLGWADLLFLVNQVFFALTFVLVAARALSERRRSGLDSALLFGVMAVVLVVPRVAVSLGVSADDRQVMVTPLILAVPYLMLRLVADFASVPWWVLRLAEAAFASELIAFFFQGSIPFPVVAAYAAVTFAWSSVAFVRGARHGRGVARRRYAAIATGNAGAVATLVVVAVSVPRDGSEMAAIPAVLVQLGVLFVGVSYFVGFATPGWLRRLWRDSDLRTFLARTPDLFLVRELDALVRETASAARDALGFDGVLIGLPAGQGTLLFRGTGADYEAPTEETFGGQVMRAGRALVSFDPIRDLPARSQLYRDRDAKMLVAAPIRLGDDVIGALTARSAHVSLFASDDLEMCQLLADQTAFVLNHRALVEEREYQADHDAVTGLPNARVLYRRLDARLAAPLSEGPFALLMVDLDSFAEVNQTFGHVVGDELLVLVAQRLAACVPETGLLARWSGDQFAVLLPGEGQAGAEALTHRLLAPFERPFTVGQDEIECGVSIGIAVRPDHAADARGLVAAADLALGIAKRAANAYAVYPLETQPARARTLALRADLRRAITAGSLHVEYQPLVSLRSGGLIRLEALVRWEDPQRGIIPPSEFIELAERTGLIRPLTELVLHQALVNAHDWRRRLPRLRVAVNISTRMFADAGLVERISEACSRTGSDPHGLSLEITESILMTEPERARQTIARLREMGITTEIDDFGTGYSSLAYLQRLPVSGIKIDRQFIAAMTADERSDSIVRATIQLSHELGFEVVAEGIEDRVLWDLLVASGCDVGQGFYIARPMAADAVRGWLGSWITRAPVPPATDLVLPSPDRPQKLVLVVDDDPALLSVVRDVLGEHGYSVMTASDGQEALAFVGKRRPDAVLLDMHMPVIDGPDFAQLLRERRIHVPVVVMTAGPNARRWAERLGASAHLAKPFAIDQLLEVTRRVTGGGSPAMN